MSNYKKISNNIQQIIIDNPKTTDKKLTWLNISNPGKKEIEFLRKKYKFDLKYLQASSAKIIAQRPKVRRCGEYLFMILHFPVLEDDNIKAGEIEFFVGHGYLITLHNNNIHGLNSFFNSYKKGDNTPLSFESESSSMLLYELLEKLMVGCYKLLDKNSVAIEDVEKVIFSEKQQQAASQIMALKRNIINFRKIMQNHKNILKTLMEMKSSLVPARKLKNYYFNLVDRAKRIWDILENQKEMIEILYQTNESLLNYRLNDIMKTLTIFSVIVFPLTLLAAIFGMNTMNSMPLVNHPSDFWIILIIMLLGCVAMLGFFKWKRWI